MKYVNGEIRPQMKQALGRDPTSQEMYLGHHFGPARAAKMIASGHPETPVADVFSRRERALNPHFDKAGTTGNLMSSINSDMDARTAKFGGGAQVAGTTPANTAATPFDYSAFGPAVGANGADMLDESPAAKTANKSSAPQQTAQAQEDDGAPQLTAPRFSQPKPVSIPAAAKTQVAQNAVPMPKLPSLSKASFGLDPSKVLAARPDQLAPGLSLLMGQPNA
jgi:hypothetical protein